MAAWARTEEENRRNQGLQRLDAELNPQRSCLYKCFIFISFLTGCSATLMGIGQVLGVMYDQQDAIQLVLRLYVSIMCALIVLNELEWTKYVRESAILRIWITRGIFYAFCGLLGLDQNARATLRSDVTVGTAAATLYFSVVAWFMIGCGTLYTLLGLCCMQIVHDRMQTSYQARVEQAKVAERATFLYRDAVEGGGGGTTGTGSATDRVI